MKDRFIHLLLLSKGVGVRMSATFIETGVKYQYDEMSLQLFEVALQCSL